MKKRTRKIDPTRGLCLFKNEKSKVRLREMKKIITVTDLLEAPFYFQIDGKFVRWDKLKGIVKQNPEIVERVTAIKRGKSNKVLKLKFPIIVGPEMALLIAKSMGDGHFTQNFRLTYYNNQKNLIEEVKAAVKSALGKTDYPFHNKRDKSGCYRVRFPSIVGYFLYLLGAPRGSKVKEIFGIPNWIRQGSKETKVAFLKGLFDDEGTIVYDVKSRKRAIIFAMGKQIKLKNSLLKFLEEIRALLLTLDIESSPIHFQKQHNEVVIYRFSLYRRYNLNRFNKLIGSSHTKKSSILNKIDSSYQDIHKTKNTIVKILRNSKTPLTTPNIAEITGLKNGTILAHLNPLYKNGIISKSKSAQPAEWSSDITCKLYSKKERVWNVVSKNPKTAKEICELTKISYKYVLGLLNRLRREEKVTCKGKQPKYWKSIGLTKETTSQTTLNTMSTYVSK